MSLLSVFIVDKMISFIVLISVTTAITLWSTSKFLLLMIRVQGRSMAPFLLPGDRVIVLRYWPSKWLSKGQVAVFVPPLSENEDQEPLTPTSNRLLFIKRVIGLPGDTVITDLRDLPEFERASQAPAYNEDGKRVWHIPPDHFFAKGDSFGTDSLTWGPIPNDRLVGVMLVRLAYKNLGKRSSSVGSR